MKKEARKMSFSDERKCCMKLPAGTSDFWNSANLQAILSSGSSNRKEIE